MHKGTEIDFVLNDSLKALELYQTIFDEIQLKSFLPCMARDSICWMKTRLLV